jgi:hypothetical protein
MSSLEVNPRPVRADDRSRMSPRRHLPALAGFLVLTAVVLWPAVRHFRTRPLADGVDGAVFEWVWWAMPRAVADGRNPYPTDLMFHPVGADLALTTTAPLVSAVTWPVHFALGSAAQINLVQLASMFLAGFATYLLANRVSGHRGASFVAGMGYALLPHRFVHVDGHLNLVWTAVLPLGVLALLRLAERPTSGRAAVLGLVAGSAFLVEPQLVVLLAACLVPIAVVHRRPLASAGWRLAATGLVALVVASPLLVPMVAGIATGEGGQPDPTGSALEYSASPLSWVVPPLEELQLGRVASLDTSMTATNEGIAYPGLILLGLAIAGAALVDPRHRRGWVALSVVGFVLSLGPYLHVRDAYLNVPLPFFGLRLIPGLDAMRVPGRFAVVGALGIHVLAAGALAALARRFERRAVLLVGVAALLSVVELLPASLPQRDVPIPEAYSAIAADDGDGAVLEIPLKWSTGQRLIGFHSGQRRDFMFLVAAKVHGRPIVSGSVSRYSNVRLDRLFDIPLYRQVLALAGEPGIDDPADFGRDDLQALGIEYVVYRRDDPVPAALEHIRSLHMPVLADDGNVIVWKVGR